MWRLEWVVIGQRRRAEQPSARGRDHRMRGRRRRAGRKLVLEYNRQINGNN